MTDMSNQPQNLQESNVFNKKTIKRGIVLFIFLTLVAFIGIFIYTDGVKSLEAWKSIDISFLLIGLCMVALDIYIGGFRNHIFVREFVPGISQSVCIKANLANMFMGSVTPSQSGGGLAQWYILHRNGMTIADSIGVSFYGFISTLIFFPLSAILAMMCLGDSVPAGFIMTLTKVGFTVFTTFLIIVGVGLFAPQLLRVFVKGLSNFIKIFHKKTGHFIQVKGDTAITTLVDYKTKYLDLIKRKPLLMVGGLLLTIILYLNKYILAYVFITAFGIHANFYTVIALMAVCYMLLYFAPSPGGSGIAEVSITGLLIPVVGTEIAPSITLLHRSFVVFIPAMIGAAVVLRQLSKES